MNERDRFDKLYWFCVGVTGFGLVFLACLVWVPIPENNQRFADVILGFVTGTLISGAIAFLTGGNVNHNKDENKKP